MLQQPQVRLFVVRSRLLPDLSLRLLTLEAAPVAYGAAVRLSDLRQTRPKARRKANSRR
ncbi:MAG: hypothetical protein RL385_1824 [Pseudomonadota bacterium]|jgi:hypothetical protein